MTFKSVVPDVFLRFSWIHSSFEIILMIQEVHVFVSLTGAISFSWVTTNRLSFVALPTQIRFLARAGIYSVSQTLIVVWILSQSHFRIAVPDPSALKSLPSRYWSLEVGRCRDSKPGMFNAMCREAPESILHSMTILVSYAWRAWSTWTCVRASSYLCSPVSCSCTKCFSWKRFWCPSWVLGLWQRDSILAFSRIRFLPWPLPNSLEKEQCCLIQSWWSRIHEKFFLASDWDKRTVKPSASSRKEKLSAITNVGGKHYRSSSGSSVLIYLPKLQKER